MIACQNAYGVCDVTPRCEGYCATRALRDAVKYTAADHGIFRMDSADGSKLEEPSVKQLRLVAGFLSGRGHHQAAAAITDYALTKERTAERDELQRRVAELEAEVAALSGREKR